MCNISLSLLVGTDVSDDLEKSEVQAIIESTPELDMDLDGCKATRYGTDSGPRPMIVSINSYLFIHFSII